MKTEPQRGRKDIFPPSLWLNRSLFSITLGEAHIRADGVVSQRNRQYRWLGALAAEAAQHPPGAAVVEQRE